MKRESNGPDGRSTRDRFLSEVSHELKSPLNAMIGLVGIMSADESLDPEYQDYLKHISQSCRDMLYIIEDVLGGARFESDWVSFKKELFLLNDVLRFVDSIGRLLIARDNKDISLISRVPGGLYISLCSDPYRLKQILINLISNAIKYTDSGFVEFGILITQKNELKFYVRDSGIGIPESKQNEIFTPYYRTTGGRATGAEGTGLGLSITSSLTESLGGKLEIESVPGEGSCFSFSVPGDTIFEKRVG